MKRVLILLLSAVLMTAALTGCSSGEEDALVSKTPFPEFSEVDIAGDEISSDIFTDYDATIVNFWNNGCGSCIAEMPELEELYQDFKERNINLIGVGTDSGESREQLDTAREILKEKGVTYHNISPDPEGDFYKDFVAAFLFLGVYTAIIMVFPALAGAGAALANHHGPAGATKQLCGQQIIVLGLVAGRGFSVCRKPFLHPVKQVLGDNSGDTAGGDNFPIAVFPDILPVFQQTGHKVQVNLFTSYRCNALLPHFLHDFLHGGSLW